jgi:hypothetical protein
VIGSDAGLTGVQELAPHDARGRDLQIGIACNQAGTLAPEFKRDGRQVPGGSGHDDPRNTLIARIEDVIEALLEQLGGLGDAAFNDGDGLGVEVPRKNPRERRRGVA